MPRDFSRTLRVADQIQRELADLVQNEIKDPRVRQITITAVEVTRDYSYAKVFYTTLCSKEENVLVEKGLEHAKGFLRTHLAHRMKLRITPQLHFVFDASVERGVRLSKLIDDAIAQDKAAHHLDPDPEQTG
ncbi:MAG: 30S ribosome-binding factor RbfA [Nitrosomonas sp.]|uniref:30S ribosome-binding factor RbfA n=1 Tax=Nitrosomonas sp. TaxID=42353 RepID=UPI001A5E070D|nr:30S ribosome-binding factor RbfA [Nitrosomonas sp.]MBL8499955.1 30S ribosome-binding factor RbfA [Nitrosomonas sp.]MCG7756930.1 30S ribosome-binding factor RbfA [Nitrosomonas sp.]UJO98961.1 MAG: 30S ribosome-binding factor RbfA [Nitrosomonas sp.]UJP02257.1 MAG: 30S ribosome-binding factor RbfA [Nitrosomonas sp.]UJP07679.1 MAG: 30S ribosome-binding factor RbfA [Nitrosomonas sp.]